MRPARILALLTFAACLQFAGGGAGAVERPNILILMADNWAWPHASSLGDPVVKTPTFDALARTGVTFQNAFCSVPSCAPARAVFLTGLHAHRLGPGASLHGTLPREYPVYPDLLETAGYKVGFSGKGWAPGNVEESGRRRNPAGEKFTSFPQFLEEAKEPFCYWFSSRDPHVPWTEGTSDSIPRAAIRIPPHLPDAPAVREDIAGYYAEVENFDRACAQHLDLLRERGLLENTCVIMTGDNGWQMPRGLAHIYDDGTRVPLTVSWQGIVDPGRRVEAFIGFEDFLPTLLELAGVERTVPTDGRSFLPLLTDPSQTGRDHIFLERERHANVRRGDLSYPVRAIRTRDYLYVRNLRPDRWPAGDPEFYFAVGPYGDVDGSKTKELLLLEPRPASLDASFDLVFGKRPAEELYDLATDPGQVRNLAASPQHEETLSDLRGRVEEWMEATGDPRVDPDTDEWDRYPYYGRRPASARR